MINILKSKITELDSKKKKLKGDFSEYELLNHLEVYIELKSIDYTINIFKSMLIEELQKKDK